MVKFSLPQIIRPPARLRRGAASPSAPARSQGRRENPRGSPESEGRAGRTSQASGRRHSLLLTDDDAQVLEASERVLLGVQHLLGRLLHVPVRLLGEHAAAAVAATADSVPSRRRKVEQVGGEDTSVSGSFTPRPCWPGRSRLLPDPGQERHLHPPRAAAARHLRLRLQYGGSPLPARTGRGKPGEPPAAARFLQPPLAATVRGSGSGATEVRLSAASSATPFSLRPP